MNQEIKMVFQRAELVPYVMSDAWKFKPTKRWQWLQKAALWFLRRTGALNQARDCKTEFTEVRVDRNTVSETILAAMDEMHIMHVRPARVYMGPEMLDKLRYELSDTMSFTVNMGTGRELFGLPVTVIPWMRGVVVVPQ